MTGSIPKNRPPLHGCQGLLNTKTTTYGSGSCRSLQGTSVKYQNSLSCSSVGICSDQSWVKRRGQTDFSFDSAQHFHLLFSPCIGDLSIMANCTFIFFVTNFRLVVKGFALRPSRSNFAFWLFKFHLLLFQASALSDPSCSVLTILSRFFYKFFLLLQTDVIPVTCDYSHNGKNLRKQTVTLLVHKNTQCFFLPPWIFTFLPANKFGYMSDCFFSNHVSWELSQPEILSRITSLHTSHMWTSRENYTSFPQPTESLWLCTERSQLPELQDKG